MVATPPPRKILLHSQHQQRQGEREECANELTKLLFQHQQQQQQRDHHDIVDVEEKKFDPPTNDVDDDDDCAHKSSSSPAPPSSPRFQSGSFVSSGTRVQGGRGEHRARLRHHHPHHVHFSPRQQPSSTTSSSQRTPIPNKSCGNETKLSSSWTDHTCSRRLRDRAASFSPSLGHHHHQQQQKRGNIRNRSDDSQTIISSWQPQPLHFTPSSVPKAYDDDVAPLPPLPLLHRQKLPTTPVPSWRTPSEFPPLPTPTTSSLSLEARVKKEAGGKVERSTTSRITASSWSGAVKATNPDADGKNNSANDNVSSPSSAWMRDIPPLPLLDVQSTHQHLGNGVEMDDDDDRRTQRTIGFHGGKITAGTTTTEVRFQNYSDRRDLRSANHPHGTLLVLQSTAAAAAAAQSVIHSNNSRTELDIVTDDVDGAAPFSSYYAKTTTMMSAAALLNDIGTVFARSNRVDEARMQFRSCIESARAALDDIPKNADGDDGVAAALRDAEAVAAARISWRRPRRRGCNKLAEAEGLARSRHELLRTGGGGGCGGDTTTAAAAPAAAAAPPSSFDDNHWNDIVQDIHQHQKLDCPSEYVYSCNGLTPLGLEYICDPLPVLGSSMRSFICAKEKIGRKRHGANDVDVAAAIVDWVALIAARVNTASLEYRLAGGGSSERLQQVLTTLEMASDDCRDLSEFLADYGPEEAFIQLLQTVVHSNIGTVKYRLNKVRECMTSFETAKSILEKCAINPAIVGDEVEHDWEDIHVQSTHHESYDDNRFPPHHYLQLAVRLNLARVSLRLSKPEEASTYCEKIIAEESTSSRPLQRRMIRSPGGTDRHHRGSSILCRSNSSSSSSASNAAFLALETATIAYEHDVDRRSQWLRSVAEHYITGLIYESKGEISDYKEAWHHYNRLLSLARVKLDHRHVYICTLLERRGAVLFEQRKLQCSMLSYLACLKILEHQQTTGSNVFDEADLSRVLYGVARVLHDREDYHDSLHMYHRALKLQRALAAAVGRPSLDVIKTLCNISRVHHLSGEIDAALRANREVMDLALILLGGKMEHPFLIHRLKIEGNILVEVGRLEDAMKAFVEAARRCSEDGRDRMMSELMGTGDRQTASGGSSSSQEDADAGDSSVLSIRSAMALAQLSFVHPAAASA